MSRLSPRRRILLIGKGIVAEACARALRLRRRDWFAGDAERAPGRARGRAPGPSVLRKADVLVLAEAADPRRELARWLPRLASLNRRWPLRLLVVDDAMATSAGVLAEAEAEAEGPARLGFALQLEYVSIPRRAARALLARWPLHWGADPRFGQGIHLLIVGDCPFADALLVQALRLSGYGAEKTRVTVLSATAADWKRRFEAAYPQAHQVAELRFESFATLDWAAVPRVTTAVICTEPAADALAQGQMLISRLGEAQRCSAPILIEVGALSADAELADWDGQLFPIDRRQLALEPAALLDGRGDEMAQVIHQHYRDTTEAQGRDPALEPAGAPWPRLAESYRDANRHQADHLWAKLALTDCRSVPEDQVESFAFAPIEVERLAIIEHGRWAADRWLDGWSYAPVRDNARKHHPQLIPYEQLSGPMKDLDRFAVRLVPTLLARSGLGVLRMLIIGLSAGDQADALPSPRFERQARQVLRRFVARYPDRALVIAAALEHSAARRFARIATAEFGAGLFLLLPQPLPSLLAGLDERARLQALALVAIAERRLSLSEPAALERWLAERAEVLVELGETRDWSDSGSDSGSDRVKRVRIAPPQQTRWSFEY